MRNRARPRRRTTSDFLRAPSDASVAVPMRRALWLAVLSVGCGKRPAPAPASTAPPPLTASRVARSAPTPPPAVSSAPPSRPVTTARGHKLKLDKRELDVATGSRAMLFRGGVVVRERGGAFVTARLGDKPGHIDDDGARFARTRTAIAESDGASWAVWIEGGQLSRARLSADGGETGPKETLAADAEEYAPAAAMAGESLVVAYVARRAGHDDDRRAKLWVEGRGVTELSGDSGASSLALLARDSSHLVAAWIDQRTALAPVHVAALDLSAPEPKVGVSSVAWNAPPGDGLLELTLSPQPALALALLAGPKNGADFGLARVPLEPGARPRDDARWLDYPNGLDPAPVVAVSTCGRPAVVFARPTARALDAPKVLIHAWLDERGELSEELEVARASRFDHVDAWAFPTGAWMLYAADGRTRVRRVRCSP